MNGGTGKSNECSFFFVSYPRAQFPTTQALCHVAETSDNPIHRRPLFGITFDHICNKVFHETQASLPGNYFKPLKHGWGQQNIMKKMSYLEEILADGVS
jgi:hypothetical protein